MVVFLQLFELDEENNLPTWFSSYLLLNNALVLWLIAASKSDAYRIYWIVLAIGFVVLSIDEVAGLHETFNTAIDTNWAIFGGLIVLGVGVCMIPFLLRFLCVEQSLIEKLSGSPLPGAYACLIITIFLPSFSWLINLSEADNFIEKKNYKKK